MQVSLVHVGVGCNRVVHAIDWGEVSFVAYAAHNAVAIYKAEVTLHDKSYSCT